MFNPKTERIQKLSENKQKTINQLESLFSGNVNIYIDYANVRPWATKLEWHIDIKRLKQFLDSFDNINSVKFYVGTLEGDKESEKFIKSLNTYHYDIRTKKVKIMRFSIDVSSIASMQSTNLINQFIRTSLVRSLNIASIEMINDVFKGMNRKGIYFIQDRKCNFDVEIGRDMLIDHERNSIDTFILWSGDSDFAEPVEELLNDGKKVVLFATARKVSRELNELKVKGLQIFDIQKIRNFICWKREISGMQKGRQ